MITLGSELLDTIGDDAVGLDVKTRRGPIGIGFWGRRWMSLIDESCDDLELEHGRRMARKSQVFRLAIDQGHISAVVAEIRAEPYFPYIKTSILTDAERVAIAEWTVTTPEITACLLAEALPEQLQDILEGRSLPPAEAAGGCSCDWTKGPCRHQVAMHCIVAEYLDNHPWALVELMGMSHLDLCNKVRVSWGQPAHEKQVRVTEHVVTGDVCHYYGDERRIPEDTALLQFPEFDVLERLGIPPFFPVGERNLKQTLEKLYKD